jgi:flagellar biosynthesis protein FlhG
VSAGNESGTLSLLSARVPEAATAGCRIWAVGGGKGGTGKSFITSSLGLTLSQLGHRVVVIDADFGGPNMHTFFGMKRQGPTLSDFFDRKRPLSELVVPTGHENLGVVSGDLNTLDSNNITYTQKQKLFRHIRALPAQYVLIDLGSGATSNIIDTFLLADTKIVVIVPEVTALENMFHFVKNVFFRQVRMSLPDGPQREAVERIWRERDRHGFTDFRGLLDYLAAERPDIGHQLAGMMEGFAVNVVLNRVRKQRDVSVGTSVRSVLMKCLGFRAQYAGYVEYDESVMQATNDREPYLSRYGTSRCAFQLRRLNENLIHGLQVRVGA